MENVVKQTKPATAAERTGPFFGKKKEVPFFAPAWIQPKLTIGAVDDPLEREADEGADKVMRMSDTNRLKAITPVVQRKCASCEEDEEGIQMKGDSVAAGTTAPHSVQNALNTPGHPLDKETLHFMEQRFGHDFRNVQVHNDAEAHGSAREITARAYTHANHIVFGNGHYRPGTLAGKHLIAHELTHVIQQQSLSDSINRDVAEEVDQQVRLSAASKQRWQKWYDEIGSAVLGVGLLGELGRAETVSPTAERKVFFVELGGKLLTQLAAVSTDEELRRFELSFDDWKKRYYDTTTKAGEKWLEVKDRYEAELLRLIDNSSMSGFYAFQYLQDIYRQTIIKVQKINTNDIVQDDFSELQHVIQNDKHIWLGELKASRERNQNLISMLRVVEELKRSGQDADKFAPDWEAHTITETERLSLLVTAAPKDDKTHFTSLSSELKLRYANAKSAHPPTKGVLEKGFDLVSGALSAITDPLVEAGKQAIDLGQILAHFASFTYYKPKFISDLGKAAEQGASTEDLLKGMIVGLLETPKRLYDAIDKGDWEAIGRESVNIYLLAKTGKQGLAKARPFIRMLRARMAGLEGGISAAAALEAIAIAKKENLVIRFRPTEKASIKLREAGHPAKPEVLKMKTVKPIDVLLGASEADIGKVGYFKPRLPEGFEKMSPTKKADIQTRFNERLGEWNNSKWRKEIADLEKEGVLKHKDGVIIDKKTGKAYTGDFDLFDIRRGSLKGESVSFESLSPETQARLKGKPIEVQHGAHLDWKEIPAGMGQGYADIVLNARPKPGSKALIEFHPDGKIRYAFFDD